MEKETVLEIEFQPVFDKWAWKITKQNEEILERNNFKDEELNVASSHSPCFEESFLFVKGVSRCCDGIINICTAEEKALIEEKVKAINEKYGIKKRWRAKYGYCYYYINDIFEVCSYAETFSRIDNAKYETLNYFKTGEEALEYAKYMKKCSLEWHEMRENNG
jgi:hypothetical protein F3_00887